MCDRTRRGAQQLQRSVAQLYQAGDYEAALSAAQQCASATKGLFGDKHPVYASALNNLGAVQKVRPGTLPVRCVTPTPITRRLRRSPCGHPHRHLASTASV